MNTAIHTERRTAAARKIGEARGLLRSAGVDLDGLGETASRRLTTAIVAIDDVIDALVVAEELDRELDRIESAQ